EQNRRQNRSRDPISTPLRVGGPETSCRGMEFSKPTEQKDLQDYGAGDEAQEARLQEHRTSRPALKRGPSFPARLEPFQKLLVYLAWRRVAFSATRAFTMRVTRSEGRGRSGVKRRVPFPVSNGSNSAENWRRTLALATKKLQ